MVDYDPWSGDFTGTIVYNNTILGGFATGVSHGTSKGLNTHDAIIKWVLLECPDPLLKRLLT